MSGKDYSVVQSINVVNIKKKHALELLGPKRRKH